MEKGRNEGLKKEKISKKKRKYTKKKERRRTGEIKDWRTENREGGKHKASSEGGKDEESLVPKVRKKGVRR